MIEHADPSAEFGDIEEMVRAAGGYLDISDDLRPRTLEEARHDRLGSSNRTWMVVVVAVLVLCAMSASQLLDRFSMASPPSALVRANADQLMQTAAQRKATQVKAQVCWTLVDSFSELRQRQASLLEDAF